LEEELDKDVVFNLYGIYISNEALAGYFFFLSGIYNPARLSLLIPEVT
jgi:hypothetical protein